MFTKNNKTACQHLYRTMVPTFSVLLFCLLAFISRAAGSIPNTMNNTRSAFSPTPDTIPEKTAGQPEIFTKVDQDAKYPGDWVHFLTTNLRGDTPLKNGAKPGRYQVIVQFVVDTKGDVSDIKVLKDPGFGTGEEAARVIRISGKWIPAMQNKRPVKAYRKQPITFMVN